MSAMKTATGGTSIRFWLWMLALVTLVGLGIFGAIRFAGRSEAEAVPWGLLVPSYIFCALCAAGVSLINSFSTVFRIDRFKPVIKRGVWLSLILIIPALLFILLDLGKTTQFANMFFFFHVSSRLAWMGVFYTIFGVFLVLQLIYAIRDEYVPKWAPLILGIGVLLVTLTIETNSGALFGAVETKPLWANYLMPLQFVVSALLVGAALHILFANASYQFKKMDVPGEIRSLFAKDYRPLLIGLIVVNLVVMASKYIPELMSSEASAYAKLLVAGPYSFNFWGLEVVLGCLVPLAILLLKRTRLSAGWLVTAAAFIVIGVFFSKYDLIIAGQSIGPTFTEAYTSYFPSIYEILTVVGGIALALLVYTLGDRWLPLDMKHKPGWFIFAKKDQSLKQGATTR